MNVIGFLNASPETRIRRSPH